MMVFVTVLDVKILFLVWYSFSMLRFYKCVLKTPGLLEHLGPFVLFLGGEGQLT